MKFSGFTHKTGMFPKIAVLFLFIAASVNAQVVELNLKLKDESILIGKPTQLKLEIIKHQNVTLNAFPLKDSLNRDIEIVDSTFALSGDTLTRILTITSFKPGIYRISKIPLVFFFEGNTDTIFSPELSLTVIPPEIDSKADIKDIKPPLTLPFQLREIIPQAGLVISILAILAIVLVFVIRKFRKKKIEEEADKLLPEYVIALRELDRIKESKLWQNGKVKEYYSRLSDAIRAYIEKRFKIPAMEFVTSETMASCQKLMPDEKNLLEMLEGILQTADMVKFAKEDPLPATNQGNLDNAYLFVEKTKIEEPASVEMEKLSKNDKIEKE